MKTCRIYAALLVFFFLNYTSVFGYSDPIGEIHPLVLVDGIEFSVLFRDNRDAEGSAIIYKRTFSSTGNLLKGRQVASGLECRHYFGLDIPLTVPDCDKIHTQPRDNQWDLNTFYGIDQHSEGWSDSPFYVSVNVVTLQVLRHALDIKSEKRNSDVSKLYVSESSVVMLLSTFNTDVSAVSLLQFDRKSGALIHESDDLFNNMPVSSADGFLSNMAERNSIIYFVSNINEKSEDGAVSHKLYLSSYDLGNHIYNEIPLDLKSAPNISMSIGIIGSHLCLSYHGNGEQISVEFIDLKKG